MKNGLDNRNCHHWMLHTSKLFKSSSNAALKKLKTKSVILNTSSLFKAWKPYLMGKMSHKDKAYETQFSAPQVMLLRVKSKGSHDLTLPQEQLFYSVESCSDAAVYVCIRTYHKAIISQSRRKTTLMGGIMICTYLLRTRLNGNMPNCKRERILNIRASSAYNIELILIQGRSQCENRKGKPIQTICIV